MNSCDGIICFGGVDWWYHNRGHYDLQMMREFSREMPVLYVNSIGMRMPKPGRGKKFAARIARKLRSIGRGFCSVRPNFGVCSPFAIPGSLGHTLTRAALVRQVNRHAKGMGINRPLAWVACPPAIRIAQRLNPSAVVYQRTDRFESYLGVNPVEIRAFDREAKKRADLTVFCSSSLMREESAECSRAAFVDHGVDFEAFASAGFRTNSEPTDLQAIGRPRIGFVGGIDAHTFDPELFIETARSMPDHQFILVGACSLPNDWCTLSNVHQFGQRPYEQVASYMAACDVLIMPWNGSEWIKACNPVKLKEYLAVGRPVVSTRFDELESYAAQVAIVDGVEEFVNALNNAIQDPGSSEFRRSRVRNETWAAKASLVKRQLASLDIAFTNDHVDATTPMASGSATGSRVALQSKSSWNAT